MTYGSQHPSDMVADPSLKRDLPHEEQMQQAPAQAGLTHQIRAASSATPGRHLTALRAAITARLAATGQHDVQAGDIAPSWARATERPEIGG